MLPENIFIRTLGFEYFPEGFKLGLVISGISLLLLTLGGLLWGKYLQGLFDQSYGTN